MKAKPLRFALALWAVTDCLAGCETKQQAASAPPPVEFVEVMQKDVPVAKEWVATLDGFVNAQIRAQVKGLLVTQNYTNGAFVQKASPSFKLDRSPFRAHLNQPTENGAGRCSLYTPCQGKCHQPAGTGRCSPGESCRQGSGGTRRGGHRVRPCSGGVCQT